MQVQLSEQQLEVLRGRAAHEQASMSKLVRRAVDTWIGSRPETGPSERRRRAIEAAGRFSSGAQNVAERHDEYLADAFDR
ncbi:MAG: hypothetical protein LGR52_11935 [Candidatus Thiosymbion ectosymbiont of Robbea hypermnestra]|nr:hypothetical protein [Candidatus Thiosymbion ectosymbiont of Robbea hypermnestra]